MSLQSLIRNWRWLAPIAVFLWSGLVALTTWAYGVSRSIAPLSNRIDTVNARVDVVEKTQGERRPLVDSIPVLTEKMTSIDKTVQEIARDTKLNGERLARVEGLLSKQVAANK